MALTKVTGQVIKNTTDVTVGVLTVTNTLAVGGTVSIGGTLTYEDVTNIDSVGLITARNGVVVGSGITLSKDGDGFFTGVITATSYSGIDLSNVTGAQGDFSIADKIVHTGDTDTVIRFPSADTITAETGGSERVRITSTGLFGIGTTPEEIFHVKGPSETVSSRDGVFLQHNTDSDAADTGLPIVWSGRISSGLTNYGLASICGRKENSTGGNGASYLQFATCNSAGSLAEKLRLTSGGSLLLGHTSSEHSDGYQLELSATNSNSSIALTSIQNNVYASQLSFVKARGSSLGARTVVQDGDLLGQFAFYGADGTNRALGCTINVVVDGTPGNDDMPTQIKFATSNDGTQSVTDRLRLRSSGDVQVPNGNVVIQTSGKGIDFSAAGGSSSGSVSALLDDYEEGTCVPTQGNGSFSPSSADGKYTKVGRLVTWMMHVVFDSTSSTNHLQIGNFPFTAGGGRAGAGIVRYSNDDEAYEISFHVDGGGATATAYYLNGGGIVQSQAVSAKRYDITFVYEAAS